jgi:hypothetical protein
VSSFVEAEASGGWDDFGAAAGGPLFGGRGWDLPQGTEELDNRLVAPGGELLHGAAEVLCLLV